MNKGYKTCDVVEHLLHVGVLVPELIGPGQDRDGAVPQVSCVVHLLVSHLHLRVLEPQSDVSMIHVQCSLIDGSEDETHTLVLT